MGQEGIKTLQPLSRSTLTRSSDRPSPHTSGRCHGPADPGEPCSGRAASAPIDFSLKARRCYGGAAHQGSTGGDRGSGTTTSMRVPPAGHFGEGTRHGESPRGLHLLPAWPWSRRNTAQQRSAPATPKTRHPSRVPPAHPISEGTLHEGGGQARPRPLVPSARGRGGAWLCAGASRRAGCRPGPLGTAALAEELDALPGCRGDGTPLFPAIWPPPAGRASKPSPPENVSSAAAGPKMRGSSVTGEKSGGVPVGIGVGIGAGRERRGCSHPVR